MTKWTDPQVAPEHYDRSYDHRRRFVSYWNQVDQVLRSEPQVLLEVGIGNGFVSRYLRHLGLELRTVDLDERLGPDVVASVTDLPFDDDSFDVACCFETLEHLPWEQFPVALRELKRIARRRVLISLPDVTPCLRLRLGLRPTKYAIDLSRDWVRGKTPEHVFDGQHYWEIGARGTGLPVVQQVIEQTGLRITEVHRDAEDPYHRFFGCDV